LKRARLVKGGAPQKDWDSKALAGISHAQADFAQTVSLLTRYISLLERQAAGGMILAERDRMHKLIAQFTTPVR
jgi:hypothetical protein